jgi:pimeloyl-ACP methyl ester carboxylesterase
VAATIERRFVEVPAGTVHCAVAGEGDPVLLLHQTPRSWDEYRDVLPLLGRRRQAIAIDTMGFGDSSRLPDHENSIETWASVVVSVLDALTIERSAIVGHHTGGYIAAEVAAAYPDRVRAVILSAVSLHSEEVRAERASGRAIVDDVEPVLDGSHLLKLWRGRAAFYPPSVELLRRFMIDCLRAEDLAAEGHRVVARYAIEDRLPQVHCPVLLIGPTADPYAYPSVPKLRAALPHAVVTEIEGGMVPLPDQRPEAFAAAVEAFLDSLDGAADPTT